MPVRTVSNRGGSVIGRFPSIKMGRMIAFESLLERDFIYLLDYDVRVEWFEEQPLTIEYQHDAQTLHYTPDFQVVEAGHPVLVECKPTRFVDTADNQRKFAVARDWCATRRWEFRVVTEQHIRAGCRLANIRRLTQYARQSLDPALRSRIDLILRASAAPLTLQEVVQAIGPDDPNPVIAGLLHLAFHHQLELTLDRVPLSGQTLVTRRAQAPQAVQP
jgi:hypothetical protein